MTKTVTLLFPGQGSQYVGMGQQLSNQEYFNKACDVLGFDLKKLCFEGPLDKLKQTENTQPALVTHCFSIYSQILPILKQLNISIERVLGHSVGEFSALLCAGVLSFEDALSAVRLRGRFMQEAVPIGEGKMIAILKVPQEKIVQACKEVSTPTQKVNPANFNEPNQIVISGHSKACDDCVKWLNENFEGKMRAIELPVSAPFHCSLMRPAEVNLKEHLDQIQFNQLNYPYVANVDAKQYSTSTDVEMIRNNLIKQVCSSVLWTQSIQNLTDDTICLEVGPGKVLTGLVRKINPNIKTLALDNEEVLKNFADKISTLLE